jgi:hypothetical protein
VTAVGDRVGDFVVHNIAAVDVGGVMLTEEVRVVVITAEDGSTLQITLVRA